MNKYLIILWFLICSGALLFFYAIGTKPLWIDELASIYNAYTFPRLIETIQRETNMWLYFFMLHLWLKLGDSALIVRSLSALFSIVTIPAIYLLGKEIYNKKLGLITAALFTFHSVVLL